MRHTKYADGFEAHSFRFDGPLSAHALQAFVDNGLPEGVFRAKEIIHLDLPSARYVFRLCGGRVAFESCDGNIADSRLVFIGRNIDGLQWRAACLNNTKMSGAHGWGNKAALQF